MRLECAGEEGNKGIDCVASSPGLPLKSHQRALGEVNNGSYTVEDSRRKRTGNLYFSCISLNGPRDSFLVNTRRF